MPPNRSMAAACIVFCFVFVMIFLLRMFLVLPPSDKYWLSDDSRVISHSGGGIM